MKLIIEILNLLRKLGIKVKDVIGVSKSLQKTDLKLFKDIDPKLLETIYKEGKLGKKLKEIITDAARKIKDSNVIQQRKFFVNLRKIENAVNPKKAEVIDIASRAKIPESGIKKLKAKIDLERNTRPFKEGEARWILKKAMKENQIAFNPEEIKMIKGGKGDILELFKKHYGSNAVRNLPADGSVTSTSKFAEELKWAVDENGFLVNHPKFNREAINWKLTRELVRDYSKKLDDHPYQTYTELRAHAKNENWVSDAIKKGELNESVPPDTKILTGKFPRLDPENDAFIILDAKGNRMGRYEGRVSIDKKTNKGTHQWWDRWDEKNQKLLTDKSKYKFSSATDETGKEIISEVIDLKSAPPAEGITATGSTGNIDIHRVLPQRIKQGFSTKIKLNSESENRELLKEFISRKNAEFNSLNVEQRKEILDLLDTQMKKSDFASKGVIEGGKSEIKKGIDDVMKDTSEAGLKKSIEIDNLRLEFPGITDEMINNILIDTNPQRIAEVKQTMREALEMIKRGMGPEEVLQVLKDALKRPKQASGGRIGMRSGTKIIDYAIKVAELIAKHGPKMAERWKKFYEGFAIKASNEIRQGLGKWKDLTTSQKTTQHDNLTKVTEGIIKTKKYDPKLDEYAGINIPKEFIAAQAKVKKPKVKNEYYSKKEMEKEWELENKLAKQEMEQEVSKVRTMDDLVEDAYKEVFHQPAFARSGDYKYDADILATEIAYQGGKIYDDLADVEKAAIYDLAYKRVIKDLKTRMDFEKNLKDVEQKIELQMFDPKGKTKHAAGGRIGYSDGTILPEPKPEEVYLDAKLKKLQDAKETILANPGAFDDNGAALLQSINNDIAELRKRYFDIEEIPGHATGGVSNLFRRR